MKRKRVSYSDLKQITTTHTAPNGSRYEATVITYSQTIQSEYPGLFELVDPQDDSLERRLMQWCTFYPYEIRHLKHVLKRILNYDCTDFSNPSFEKLKLRRIDRDDEVYEWSDPLLNRISSAIYDTRKSAMSVVHFPYLQEISLYKHRSYAANGSDMEKVLKLVRENEFLLIQDVLLCSNSMLADLQKLVLEYLFGVLSVENPCNYQCDVSVIEKTVM